LLNKEKQKPQESKKISRNEIEKRIDKLLRERDELLHALEGQGVLKMGVIFATKEIVESPELKKAIEEGLERIRNETEFLQPLDSLGIRVFVDDLEKQASNEEVKIEFGSEDIFKESFMKLQRIGGHMSPTEGVIRIGSRKPNLNEQIYTFLNKGELHQTVQALIHEMMHWNHYIRTSRHMLDRVLTESHAYLTSTIGERSGSGGIVELYQKLTRPDIDYKFEGEKTLKGLLSISRLLAQGLSQDAVARIIADSSYDEDKRDFFPLKDYLNQDDYDSSDMQALDDIYKLNLTNQRLKAQLLMYETLKKHFPAEMLKEIQIKKYRGIGIPTYYKKGKLVPSDELQQSVICPANAEWPYDPDGLRTGILFGFVEGDDKKIDFALGKWSATPKDSSFTPAKTPEEQEQLLSLIKKQALDIELGDRLPLIFRLDMGSHSDLSKKILKAMFTKEELIPTLKVVAETYIETIDAMQLGLKDNLSENFSQKILIYSKQVQNIQDFFDFFEVYPSEISFDFAIRFNSLKEELAQVKDEYEKKQDPIETVELKAA